MNERTVRQYHEELIQGAANVLLARKRAEGSPETFSYDELRKQISNNDVHYTLVHFFLVANCIYDPTTRLYVRKDT